MRPATRIFWLIIGILALALGGLGVFLPLLPTTPFVLVAAFAFANSSDRLLDHNIFGPLIDNWRRYGAINRYAKILSILSMAAVLVISLLMAFPAHVIVVQILVVSVCSLFTIFRPLPRAE